MKKSQQKVISVKRQNFVLQSCGEKDVQKKFMRKKKQIRSALPIAAPLTELVASSHSRRLTSGMEAETRL